MRKEVIILGAIVIVIIIAVIVGSNYYRKSIQSERVTTASGNSNKPQINPEQLVRPDSPTLGAANAPVTLVEFYDPECEACRAMHPIVKKIMKDYEGKVRLVFRYMPLHSNSMLAAQVTEAAGEQGKYWQMQDLLFQRQTEWGEKREPQTALFEKYAAEIGMNVEQMRAAIADNRYTSKIERDRQDGQKVGANRTPTFFVNGRPLARIGEQELKFLIDEELKR